MTTTSPPTTAVAARAVHATQDLRRRRDRSARARRRRRRVRARRVHRDHGPVGFGQVHAAALHRRARHAHVGPGVPRRHRSLVAQREEAHADAPRPDRLHLPDVQPHPDAHRDREHHAADGARRPRRRPGVARPHRRHRRPADRGSSTARRSSPAVSSSASPSPARSRASPRSSSPTSPPATSTPAPAPRSSSSCSRRCSELGQTIVMVTHDPTRGGVREPRRVPRRRQDRRRAPRPAPPTAILDKMHGAGRIDAHVEGHPQGTQRRTSCASCSPRSR